MKIEQLRTKLRRQERARPEAFKLSAGPKARASKLTSVQARLLFNIKNGGGIKPRKWQSALRWNLIALERLGLVVPTVDGYWEATFK